MDQQDIIEKVFPLVAGLRLYHRHSVQGIENVPAKGRCILVTNHSLATYDIMLLLGEIYEQTGRIPVALIDRLFFKIPMLGEIMQAMGARQGNQKNAERVLTEEEGLVCVAPGGMREALRPSEERYQLRWDRRLGFAKLSIKTQAPICLAACPRADDLYEVYPSWLTAWFYKNYRVPVFLARGLGLSALPRPVKLTHFVSEPIQPPAQPEDPAQFETVLKQYHRKLVKRMERLIGEAIQFKGKKK